MVSLRYTRNLFLRAFCVIYLFAFISFYIQIPGLYGDNGILPAKSVLEDSKHKTLSAKVHYQPTLLWLAPYLGLDTNYALDVLALLGSFLAFTGFISQKFCTIPLFAGLWSLYFSLYQVGQEFTKNNYDEFLLEAGFLALLVAPLLPGRRNSKNNSPKDRISFWLVRWLLFRFLLTCGLTKFISGCPKWWSLTSFEHYFETQPLPTPLSWYFHHVPKEHLRLFAIVANVCEIILPFLFFVPLRGVKVTGFIIQILLQISIVLTGNYNFTNLLLVTLLLSLLDDQFFYGRGRKGFWKYMETIANVLIHAAVIALVIYLYSLKIDGTTIHSKIAFTKDQFDLVLKQGLTFTIYIGLISLAMTILHALSNALTLPAGSGSKIIAVLSTILYGGLAVLLFFATTVPLASLHSVSNSTVHPSVRTVYKRLHKVHAVNQYGLFPKMVGVEGRPEIILEGADHVDGPWKEYNFLYKPGNVNHSLPFVAPYSPRLDWQMFWAAHSNHEKQPWIMSLAHRLLEGRPEVTSLLDKYHSPFSQKPPRYLRASLYRYKFTSWSQRSLMSWWTRQRAGEYFPAYTKDSPGLIEYLKARHLYPTPSKLTVNPIWKQILDSIRYVCSHFEATLLSWSVFTAGCAIITTSSAKK